MDVEWKGNDTGRLNAKVTYNTQRSHLSADMTVNYGKTLYENSDIELVIKSNLAEWKHAQIKGHLINGHEIQVEFSVQWSGAKKMEIVFNGELSLLKSWMKFQLSTPSILPIKAEGQYDLCTLEKSGRIVYSYGTEIHQSNAIVTVNSALKWVAKVNLVTLDEKYTATVKCDLESEKKQASAQLESMHQQSKLLLTTEKHSERTVLVASLSSPSIGVEEWRLEADYDTNKGLNSSLAIFWAAGQSVRLEGHVSSVELSASLTTPFAGFEKTKIISKFDLVSANKMVDTLIVWNGQKVTVVGSIEGTSSVLINIKTPFQGFEDMSLSATYLSDKDPSVTLKYVRGGQPIELKCKLVIDATGSAVKVTFDSAVPNVDDISAVIEYDFKSVQKTASALLVRGSKRFSIAAAGKIENIINGFVTIESNKSKPLKVTIDLDVFSEDKSGKMLLEWGQDKIEFAGGFNSNSIGRQFFLNVHTPLTNFKQMVVNGKLNPADFDLSVDLSHNQRFQLTGQYLIHQSTYSVNGTLKTPFVMLKDVSWKTYADVSNDAFVAASFQWEDDKIISLRTILGQSSSEIALETPHHLLRNVKLSAVYQFYPENHKKLAGSFEYSQHKVTCSFNYFILKHICFI